MIGRFIRWVRCKMDLGHRLVEGWMNETDAGMSKETASEVWGSRVNERGQIQYFQCLDCKVKIAPFEVMERKWRSL